MVVAVHGLMESASCLEPAFPAWTSLGFAVVAVDLRGHGQSPRWTQEQLAEHPGDLMVEDLTAVLAAPAVGKLTGITLAHQNTARAKGARVEVFPGASHFIRRDAIELFMDTASAFFAECRSQSDPGVQAVAGWAAE
jgi:pimeloyl-ACP methyl ester carboxylesterase